MKTTGLEEPLNRSLSPNPPASACYVNLGEFYSAFSEYSARVQRRIFKFERLQTYIEPGNESWIEFQKGNVERSLELLEETHAKDVDFDVDFFGRGLQFLRVRAVELPLSAYIEWELQGHIVNAKYGETILVADLSGTPRDHVLWNTRDYLLFDEFAALVHDYGTDGDLRGGWVCEDAIFLASCAQLALQLTQTSVPLGVFRNRHPFRNVPEQFKLDAR